MRRLMHRRDQERGAIALIVAVLVSALVLTGVAALTIDAGSLYAERRVLQNGADAASLALAQICANNINDPMCAETSELKNYLQGLAVDNASVDRPPSIDDVCGGGLAAEKFGACDSGAALTDCPSVSTLPANWVQVKTRFLVPSVFAGLGGAAAYKGTVQACARAAWGQLSTAVNTMPMVLNVCGWNAATASGTRFGPTNPSPPPRTSTSVAAPPMPTAYSDFAIQFYTHTRAGESATTCGARTDGGRYYPGGFGWVGTTDNAHCSASFTYDKGLWVMGGSNGAATPSGCRNESLLKFVGTTVYIPIVTAVSGTNYTIDGLAAFYVAGYRGAAVAQPNDFNGYSGGLSVSPPNEGIWGWFTAPIAMVGSAGGSGTPRGVHVVGVAG